MSTGFIDDVTNMVAAKTKEDLKNHLIKLYMVLVRLYTANMLGINKENDIWRKEFSDFQGNICRIHF